MVKNIKINKITSEIDLNGRDVTIITPRRRWFDIDIKGIWKSRHLIWLLFKRDFVAANKQSILGAFWFIFPPILSAFINNFIFSDIAKIPTDGIPPLIFYMSGTWLWSYFSANITAQSNILKSNARIFGKVYFPRVVVPISNIIYRGANKLISFGVLTFFWVYFYMRGSNIAINLNILFLPLLIIMVNASSLGIGLFLSSISYRYQDIPNIFAPLLSFSMYLSPVVYPLSTLPKGSFLFLIVNANPMTHIIEFFRYSIFSTGNPSFCGLIYSGIFTVVSLIIGLLVFNKAEQNFMDTV